MPQLKAIIEYGTVINIFVHEGGALTLPEGQMYVNVGDQGVGLGWTYDYVTHTFTPSEGGTIAQRLNILEATLTETQAVSDILITSLAKSGQIDEAVIAEHPAVFARLEPEIGEIGKIVKEGVK